MKHGEVQKRTGGLPSAFFEKPPTNWTPLYVVVGAVGVAVVLTVVMAFVLALVCVTVFGGIAIVGLVNVLMGKRK